MKKLFYILPMLALASLTGCRGTQDYDAYVETLKAQPAVIDTISSAASYAAYIDTLSHTAQAFEDKGVKLNPTQQAEIQALGLKIQEALTATHERLAQTPVTLPDSVEVPTDVAVAVPE